MALSLWQTQLMSTLAGQLYEFLPGQPHPFADQTISFAGIARDLGLARFWPSGSKLPAIQQLLTETLDKRPQDFSRLMIEVIRRGVGYRSKRGNLLTRGEMRRLNSTIEGLGMKIPELLDPAFLDGLPRDEADPAPAGPSPAVIGGLLEEFQQLSSLPPQPRGYAFEKFLNKMFKIYGLDPREPFTLTGEQVDGSFQVDGDTYLGEARYRNARADSAALASLSMKVAGKAQWSRGIFISFSGFSPDSLAAFATGKATNLICMDGLDTYHILAGKLDLAEVIRRKARRAAETNEAFVPVRQLFTNVM